MTENSRTRVCASCLRAPAQGEVAVEIEVPTDSWWIVGSEWNAVHGGDAGIEARPLLCGPCLGVALALAGGAPDEPGGLELLPQGRCVIPHDELRAAVDFRHGLIVCGECLQQGKLRLVQQAEEDAEFERKPAHPPGFHDVMGEVEFATHRAFRDRSPAMKQTVRWWLQQEDRERNDGPTCSLCGWPAHEMIGGYRARARGPQRGDETPEFDFDGSELTRDETPQPYFVLAGMDNSPPPDMLVCGQCLWWGETVLEEPEVYRRLPAAEMLVLEIVRALRAEPSSPDARTEEIVAIVERAGPRAPVVTVVRGTCTLHGNGEDWIVRGASGGLCRSCINGAGEEESRYQEHI